MDKEDLRRAALLTMLVLLVYTAPQWLYPHQARASSYEAPWIYPGLEPASGAAKP
jgi:hypothetical protein